MRRPRCFFATLIALLAVMALFLSRAWLLPCLGAWLDTGRRTITRADHAFVLGGDINTRPLAAAALYKGGLVRAVLVSHVSANQAVRDSTFPPYDEMTARVLMARGVPRDAIWAIGDGSATTYDEADALRAFLASHPDTRVIVVTSFYHTRRAEWILRRVLGAEMSRVAVVSAPAASYTAGDWWHDGLGFQAVGNEYLRLLFYLYRYGSAGRWLAAALAIGAGWLVLRRWRKPSWAVGRHSAAGSA